MSEYQENLFILIVYVTSIWLIKTGSPKKGRVAMAPGVGAFWRRASSNLVKAWRPWRIQMRERRPG